MTKEQIKAVIAFTDHLLEEIQRREKEGQEDSLDYTNVALLSMRFIGKNLEEQEWTRLLEAV